jgi:hypothetical protein
MFTSEAKLSGKAEEERKTCRDKTERNDRTCEQYVVRGKSRRQIRMPENGQKDLRYFMT